MIHVYLLIFIKKFIQIFFIFVFLLLSFAYLNCQRLNGKLCYYNKTVSVDFFLNSNSVFDLYILILNCSTHSFVTIIYFL